MMQEIVCSWFLTNIYSVDHSNWFIYNFAQIENEQTTYNQRPMFQIN